MRVRPVAVSLFALSLASLCWVAQAAEVERIRLASAGAVLEVTPALGGRVLHFGAAGRPNLIKVGEAVQAQPVPEVSAAADDIAYFGHDVWLGPQSGWWSDQSANPARRDARASWPPDPYLSFATTRVVERREDRLVLEGIDSPVTGVRLRKSFAFDPADPATVEIAASARNIRERPLSRDLWFNTRVSAATRVYVPVASAQDVRMQSDAGLAPPQWQVRNGMFELIGSPLPTGKPVRRGKLLLQPSAGWMAGFAREQVFIIRFAHQPRERIHPEQGQVELYLDHGDDVAAGLLEMEVHAPLRTLAPGETMQATERWTVLRYDGEDSDAARIAFLCERTALCVDRPVK